MNILKTLEEKTFNYKGIEVKMTDLVIESDTWSRSAYATRNWTINDKPAHTRKVKGVVYLAYYDNEGLLMLGDFKPVEGFHMAYADVKEAVESVGKILEVAVEETEY